MKSKTVCPKNENITFKNCHKYQQVENVIFAHIGCYMKDKNRRICLLS